MSNSKTLTIKFDSHESAFYFLDSISELIFYNDQQRDLDDRSFVGPDDSNQIGFSWDGVTYWSCNSACRQVRQERFGLINGTGF